MVKKHNGLLLYFFLNLSLMNKVKGNNRVKALIIKLRLKAKSVPSLDEITKEVELVRGNRYKKL